MNYNNFPKLLLLKQNFSNKTNSLSIEQKNYLNILSEKDIPDVIFNQLNILKIKDKIKEGQTVAITCGSRGITNQLIIIKSLVEYLKKIGAKPFIIPAMGSHGGGTAEGQINILKSFGITEENIQCPIKATMEVVELAKTKDNITVVIDKYAYEADHIIIFNRIKAHTTLSGIVESGLMKMCLIGAGKKIGAEIYHRAVTKYSWDFIVNSAGKTFLEKSNVLFGLGVIENAYENTAGISAVLPEDFLTKEPFLLSLSKKILPSLPFNNADILIVDEIGKEISGTGIDTNIIGRKYNPYLSLGNYEASFHSKLSDIKIKKIFVRNLSEKTYGNANGIGLVDITTKRLFNIIDFKSLYTNAITACRTDSVKIPLICENDKEAISLLFNILSLNELEKAKIMWIKNTLKLEYIIVSEAYKKDIEQRNNLEILSNNIIFDFDNENNLLDKF